MAKSLKKVYLPAGLIASLYNVYGGRGVEGDALTTYDIQLLCAFTEFYYNYTEIDNKDNVYWFYTLPQFYKAYNDVVNDDLVQKENSTLEGRYIKRVYDESNVDNPNGKLYLAAKELAKSKKTQIDKLLAKGVPSEIDKSIYQSANNQSIDYASLATNPYAFAKQLESEQNFRTVALYNRERVSRVDPTKKLPVFGQRPCRDESCFFVLNPTTAGAVMTDEQFARADQDMNRRLRNFFNSDCYKAMSDQKREDYAPEAKTFLKYFCKAVSAFNKLKFVEENRRFNSTIKKAEEDFIGIEIISE